MTDLFHKLRLIRTPGIGPAKYAQLIRQFGSAAAAAQLAAGDDVTDAVRREMDRAAALGIHYICDDDDLYPAALRGIKNHPPVITARGNIKTLGRAAVAMVGTRHATAAGMGFMADMAREFATRGMAVVSGMAMGTDTAAHRGALRAAGDAQTIAVLAGGADYIWPVENESLYWDIVGRGVVISEMPVGYMPTATNFVQRNRWVAGICDKLILGEADLKSGSMTTARFAIESNRPVFAVPAHPSDPRSAGPNSLIRAGHATICTGISDFFDGDVVPQTKNEKNVTSENILLDRLGMIPLSESVLSDVVKKSISEIKRDLVVLELQGLVRKVDGGYVRM
ncbi:MAG: DNA-processing protein DprA [Alphaproteobacteria bacterium]|nr:DNA-processing protein DprA [Alphaproteobacteria bacterium]MDE6571272.1 DNA-processing protein DprA [Alphaproteobacteria bacterium]